LPELPKLQKLKFKRCDATFIVPLCSFVFFVIKILGFSGPLPGGWQLRFQFSILAILAFLAIALLNFGSFGNCSNP